MSRGMHAKQVLVQFIKSIHSISYRLVIGFTIAHRCRPWSCRMTYLLFRQIGLKQGIVAASVLATRICV